MPAQLAISNATIQPTERRGFRPQVVVDNTTPVTPMGEVDPKAWAEPKGWLPTPFGGLQRFAVFGPFGVAMWWGAQCFAMTTAFGLWSLDRPKAVETSTS